MSSGSVAYNYVSKAISRTSKIFPLFNSRDNFEKNKVIFFLLHLEISLITLDKL